MLHSLVLAGFGGQGVLLAGQLIAYGGMMEGKHVAWIPSYGPEMRGGTANCGVSVSDRPISSPLVEEPGALLAFNLPSLDKFEARVTSGGLVIYNASLIPRSLNRKDVSAYPLYANDMAAAVGNSRAVNMVMLGAYLRLTGAVSLGSVKRAMEKVFAEKGAEVIESNAKALTEGWNSVKGIISKGA